MRKYLLFFLFLLFLSREDLSSAETSVEKPEIIRRKSRDFYYLLQSPSSRKREAYPWEIEGAAACPKITKEFFRCRGSSQNPQKSSLDKSKTFSDCIGGKKHPLPFIHDKEEVCPILLDLLNFVQKKTQKRVVITCGHRCLLHNTYADPSKENLTSKHMMGAEVDFYVAGMEQEPEKIVELLKEFYRQDPLTKNQSEFTQFLRYEKKTNVSTFPWYNKEIFIKLFQKEEGRDFDNCHGYPYLCIQVRFDRLAKENVVFSWEKVNGSTLSN